MPQSNTLFLRVSRKIFHSHEAKRAVCATLCVPLLNKQSNNENSQNA
jgi:hypothetical protein